MPPRDPVYSAYARHYDQIGQRRFGELSAEHLMIYLHARAIHPRSVLDLACGTGAATIPFARLGLTVTGLDRSEAMLEIARQRAKDEDLEISWVLGDMRQVELEQQFDLVTCLYDAVNYLDGLDDLVLFVQSAHGAVGPSGILAFDINTHRKLKEHWQDSTVVAADTEDRYIVYQSWFDEQANVSPLVINLFERRADGAWDRFVEEHVEFAFAINDVVTCLTNTGFDDIRVLEWREGEPGDFREGTEDSFRVLFLAVKAGDSI